jgi:hypothetical protein
MIGGTRARIAAAVLLVGLFAPGVARAASPELFAVDVFGHARPEDDPVAAATLFANSLPLGFGAPGRLQVRGNATPGVFVDVSVSDGATSVTSTTTTATRPGAGTAPGDFTTELNVTNLGVHAGTGADTSVGDPAKWGPSTLTATVVARGTDGALSAPAVRTITKYAATQHDITTPVLSKVVWPPQNWCHFSGGGIDVLPPPGQPGSGIGLGGNPAGNCGRAAPVPDATWVACIKPPVANPVDGNQVSNPLAGNCYMQGRDVVPHGEAPLSGMANDNPPPANGVASEIGDVTVVVLQGTKVLRELHPVLRAGVIASWGTNIRINDFEPNYPGGTPYVFKATVTDAWGHAITVQSPPVTVYPW